MKQTVRKKMWVSTTVTRRKPTKKYSVATVNHAYRRGKHDMAKKAAKLLVSKIGSLRHK